MITWIQGSAAYDYMNPGLGSLCNQRPESQYVTHLLVVGKILIRVRHSIITKEFKKSPYCCYVRCATCRVREMPWPKTDATPYQDTPRQKSCNQRVVCLMGVTLDDWAHYSAIQKYRVCSKVTWRGLVPEASPSPLVIHQIYYCSAADCLILLAWLAL